MSGEVTVARESGVNALNAVGSPARRQANPFRSITMRPISNAYRAELEEQGVNMRMFEAMRRDERDRRIDDEYETQLRQLRIDLREKYPLGNYAKLPQGELGDTYSKAVQQRKDYNRELAQGIKRLRRLAAAAKKK